MGKIQYIVIQELPAPTGQGRKLSLGTAQIAANLEAMLEGLWPSPVPTPPAPTPTPAPPPLPAGTITVNAGDKLSAKASLLKPGGTLALARGGSWMEPLALSSAQTKDVRITSFGSGPLPLIHAQYGLMLYGGEAITVEGLHFQGTPNTGGNGVHVICNGIKGLTFTGNIVQGFRDNVVIQCPAGDAAARSDYHTNVLLANNVILDSAGSGERDGQGIYCQNVDGLTIQENLIDGAGMNRKNSDGSPNYNIYCHGMYLQHGNKQVHVLRNVVSRAESYGIQTRGPDMATAGDDTSDPGHVVNDNIMVDCAIGFANSGMRGTGTGNYFLPGHFHTPQFHHGQGMGIIHCGSGDFSNNTRLTGPAANAKELDWVMPFLDASPDQKDPANLWRWVGAVAAKASGRDYNTGAAGVLRVVPAVAGAISTYRGAVLGGVASWDIGQLRDSLAANIEAAIAAAQRGAATK